MSATHDLDTYIQETGHLPLIGDVVKPWQYKGWLLRYIILAHEEGRCSGRWPYHLKQIESGRLLAKPIPEVVFGQVDKKIFSSLRQWSEIIGWDCGGWSDFRKLLDWLAWGLQVSDELPELSHEKHEKLYRCVNLIPFLDSPRDYFGDYICELRGKGNACSGFHPTPHEVVSCMVEITMSDYDQDSRDRRILTVNDPCLGTGRMLMYASNYSLRLSGQDIDSFVLQCAKINFAMYVPWAVFPYPDKFFEMAVQS